MKVSRTWIARFVDVLCRVGMGGLFIYAACTKIQDPAVFAQAVAGYRILPDEAVGLFALVLPMLELVAGFALVFTKWSREAGLVLLGLMGAFLVGLVQAQVRGLDISCGCFGDSGDGKETVMDALVRDVFLLVPLVWLVCRPNGWLFGRRAAAACVLMGAVLLGVQTGRADDAAAPTGTVVQVVAPATNRVVGLEAWTTNFPAALAAARAEQRPLIAVVGSRKCLHCRRLEHALSGPCFRRWVKGTGFLLARTHTEDTNNCPGTARMLPFLMEMKPAPGMEFPYVGVYWARATNETFQTVFSGRRGVMPGNRHDALVGEFTSALETLLGDYLKTREARRPIDEILEGTTKTFMVATEGKGKVSLSPESGKLRDDGTSLRLTIKPANGFTFTGIALPNGKVVPTRKCKRQIFGGFLYEIRYRMPAGAYTVRFRKK